MHAFLTALGWLLLGLAAALLLLLFLPVCVTAEYREGALSVRLRLLGVLRLSLDPFAEKAPKKKPDKKKRAAARGRKKKAADEPQTKPKKAPPSVEELLDLLSAAGVLTRRSLRALHIRGVILILPIHREDAAETAVACGKTQAWLNGVLAALRNFLDIRVVQVRTLPDYTNEITAGPYFTGSVSALPVMFLVAGVCALAQLLRRAASRPNPREPGPPAGANGK